MKVRNLHRSHANEGFTILQENSYDFYKKSGGLMTAAFAVDDSVG
jgi:hypothetical protein